MFTMIMMMIVVMVALMLLVLEYFSLTFFLSARSSCRCHGYSRSLLHLNFDPSEHFKVNPVVCFLLHLVLSYALRIQASRVRLMAVCFGKHNSVCLFRFVFHPTPSSLPAANFIRNTPSTQPHRLPYTHGIVVYLLDRQWANRSATMYCLL